MHEQMFRLGGQSDQNPQCSVPKKAWYSIINTLKGRKAESTLLSPGFEPWTCSMEVRCTNHSATGLHCNMLKFHFKHQKVRKEHKPYKKEKASKKIGLLD
ncbi:hypothetical protein TNCV_2716511 [Trichonephila clavipes]|nr:hypothetical protein TNCV_2716511 [Trichonephila clavipes]